MGHWSAHSLHAPCIRSDCSTSYLLETIEFSAANTVSNRWNASIHVLYMLGLWACVELINCWAMPALRQVWAMPHCLLVLPRVPELSPCCPRRFIQHPFKLALFAPQRIKLSGPKLYTLKFRLENRPGFHSASLCHVASVIVLPASSMTCCRHPRPSCQSLAHSERFTPCWPHVGLLGSSSAQHLLPSSCVINRGLRQAAFLVGKEGLIGLPVDCPQRSFRGCPWHRCRRCYCGAPRGADEMPSM